MNHVTKPADLRPEAPLAILNPAELPERYGLICTGDCLEPEIRDGAKLLFSSAEPYKVGDFVVLFWRPEMVKRGQLQAVVKRLVIAPPPYVKMPYREHPKSEIAALVIVEMLNPRRQFAVRCEDLLGIHKCLGQMPSAPKPVAMRSRARTMPAPQEIA